MRSVHMIKKDGIWIVKIFYADGSLTYTEHETFAGALAAALTASRDTGEHRHTEKSGECLYCGRYIEDAERIPSLGDDAGWERIRHEHDDDCEWWTTRANRLEV